MGNKDKYIAIFCEVFSVDKEELNESFTFENIEAWDSMTHLTLINELEEIFEVFFETDDILHYGGFINGIDILKKYGIDF